MPKTKITSDKHIPGLGSEHEIGMTNVGITIVDTTLCANPASIPTNAGIISAIPNTGAASMSYGPVVHSLGVPPSFAFGQLRGNVGATGPQIAYEFVTSDNSAVYIRAQSLTAGPIAVSSRIVIVR
jgi:hypothetical protein